MRLVFKGSHRRDDVFHDIGLGNKKCVGRDFQRADLTGGDNDVNRRPPVSNGGGQFEAIHGTRHIDIGENEMNVLTGFKNGNGLIRVICDNNSVSASWSSSATSSLIRASSSTTSTVAIAPFPSAHLP